MNRNIDIENERNLLNERVNKRELYVRNHLEIYLLFAKKSCFSRMEV